MRVGLRAGDGVDAAERYAWGAGVVVRVGIDDRDGVAERGIGGIGGTDAAGVAERRGETAGVPERVIGGATEAERKWPCVRRLRLGRWEDGRWPVGEETRVVGGDAGGEAALGREEMEAALDMPV